MTLRTKFKPREVGALTEREEYALAHWPYYDRTCDMCGSAVPEFEPYIADPWTPWDGSWGEKVFCSNYCFHWHYETLHYVEGHIPDSHIESKLL